MTHPTEKQALVWIKEFQIDNYYKDINKSSEDKKQEIIAGGPYKALLIMTQASPPDPEGLNSYYKVILRDSYYGTWLGLRAKHLEVANPRIQHIRFKR